MTRLISAILFAAAVLMNVDVAQAQQAAPTVPTCDQVWTAWQDASAAADELERQLYAVKPDTAEGAKVAQWSAAMTGVQADRLELFIRALDITIRCGEPPKQ